MVATSGWIVPTMRPLALTFLLVLLSACGGEQGPRAVIETKDDEVTVHVEVADTEAERARGLMGRRELLDDAGMVFVFPTDSTSAFWMKDTLIPLSIAFYDESGTIVRILDMEPCTRDPCVLYDPEASYRGALEVNRGAFERWGVREGDVLRLER
jgi:uncharacterized membrane protein (UPF0127 family)